MASVCFYFQVHQPFRLRRYSVFDSDHNYFDEEANRHDLPEGRPQVLPAGQPRDARPDPPARGPLPRRATRITGVRARAVPAVRARRCWTASTQLAETGCVEFLAETYYHSPGVPLQPRGVRRAGATCTASMIAGAVRPDARRSSATPS